jgi:hypothetical protein
LVSSSMCEVSAPRSTMTIGVISSRPVTPWIISRPLPTDLENSYHHGCLLRNVVSVAVGEVAAPRFTMACGVICPRPVTIEAVRATLYLGDGNPSQHPLSEPLPHGICWRRSCLMAYRAS